MVRVIYSVLLRALLHGCAFLTTVEEGAAPLISALQMLKKRAALRNSLSPDVTPACTLYVENFLFTWSNLVLSFCECHPPHTAHSIPGVPTYSQLLMQHLTEPAIYIQWELGDDKVNNLTTGTNKWRQSFTQLKSYLIHGLSHVSHVQWTNVGCDSCFNSKRLQTLSFGSLFVLSIST